MNAAENRRSGGVYIVYMYTSGAGMRAAAANPHNALTCINKKKMVSACVRGPLGRVYMYTCTPRRSFRAGRSMR